MISKANRRSALILATGILVLLAGPSQAANDTNDSAAAATSEGAAAAPVTLHRIVRHASHHRYYAQRRSRRIAAKDSEDKAINVAAADDSAMPTIPPSVANANAQFPSVAPQPGAATAIPAPTNAADSAPDQSTEPKTDTGTLLVAADELNDVDRTLHEGDPPVPPADIAANPPPAPTAKASHESSSVWDETSLIGKIFIGFGTLLTMASAARMFMA